MLVSPESSSNLYLSDRPLVSVIIIFLNAERFIEEAIESVSGQTYSNWELLLVDDGSTDGSRAIALRYAEMQPERVRYLNHAGRRNRGMSASRNLGIRHARGEYIAFLDADDVWLPHKLHQQVAILNSHPEAGMVYGASQYWHSWTGSLDDVQRDYVLALGVGADKLVKPRVLLTLLLQSKAPTPCPSDILLRRETLEAVGGFEESFRGIYQLFEDQAFLAKVYLRKPVFVSSECWDRYRQHADSCVSVVGRSGRKYTAGLFFFDWLEGYLSANGVTDGEVWQALRKKRWRYRHPNLHRVIGQARNRVIQIEELLKSMAQQALPANLHDRLRAHWHDRRGGPRVE
jgi:glycosyltransferase involved in cell wall biosynthesis